MAEEKEAKAAEAAEVVVAEAVKEGKPAPEAEVTKKAVEEAPEDATAAETDAAIQQSVSFKEESNLVGDLQEPEKKALDELKQLIQAALSNNEFNPPPPPAPPAPKSDEPKPDETPAAEPKPDQTPAAEPKPDETPAADPKTEEPASTDPKVAELVADAPKAEEPAAPAAAVVEPLTVVKAVVDEDGAKTVEAIEETVVPIAPPPPPTETVAETEASAPAPEPEFIWGVPLLGDEKSDTVLLKFLRARDFKVKDALAMIKNAVIWRKEFEIEKLLGEDLALPELEKVVFYHGQDKEGHPVCYNVYGEFQSQELYAKAFSDDEKRDKFLRWRIQFLEKGIRQQLDFSPQGVSSMVQVTDLKNVPGPGKKELRQATKKALALLQDSYPEFVAKQVFINVPWWYLAYNRVMSPFFTQRTKSKFVFAGPSKSAETLFRYIAPEHVPVQYGGLSKDNDSDFSSSDAVTEVVIKPSSKHTIELPASEPSLLTWELRVLGWDVSYSAEFVPGAEDAYTVLVQKARKFTAADEPFVKNNFKVGEPGKIVLTINNAATKKKKLLYRSKTKNTTDSA